MENEKEYFCEHCSHDVTLTELNTCPVCGADLSQPADSEVFQDIQKKLKSGEAEYLVPEPYGDVVISDENTRISLRKVYEDVERLKKEIELLKEEDK